MVRVRFAPSPTGHLHIGGARSALFNWLFARHHKGAYLLRIEDTDSERSEQRYIDSIRESFAWLDIVPDESPVIQSSRRSEHQAVIERMLHEGTAYRCYCSTEELEKARAHEESLGSYFKYPGICRTVGNLGSVETPYVVRFKIPDTIDSISWQDIILGETRFEREQLDDFVIARSDGSPMYNFVVVVDDAFMGITHVIRAQEHVINTPRQILLYKALGYTVPQFAHVPLILGASGQKLSKRDAAVSVLEYRAQGFLPNALCNYLVRLGWAYKDQEIFTRDEMVSLFDLAAVGKNGAMFDTTKLLWVNSVYMRALSGSALGVAIDNNLRTTRYAELCAQFSELTINSLCELYKMRTQTLVELLEAIEYILRDPVPPLLTEVEQSLARDILVQCDGPWDHGTLKVGLQKIGAMGVVGPVMRKIITGELASPGVIDLMVALGRSCVVGRIEAALKANSR